MNASSNRLAGLKAKPKGNLQKDIKTADRVGEAISLEAEQLGIT